MAAHSSNPWGTTWSPSPIRPGSQSSWPQGRAPVGWEARFSASLLGRALHIQGPAGMEALGGHQPRQSTLQRVQCPLVLSVSSLGHWGVGRTRAASRGRGQHRKPRQLSKLQHPRACGSGRADTCCAGAPPGSWLGPGRWQVVWEAGARLPLHGALLPGSSGSTEASRSCPECFLRHCV